MARIPIYQRQTVQDGLPGVTRYSGDSSVGRALENMGNMGARLGGAMIQQEQIEQEKAKREQDDLAKIQTANILSEGQVYWQEEYARRAQAWKVGDPDLREGLAKDYDKWVAENSSKLTTPSAQQYFQLHSTQMKTGLQTNAFEYQKKATTLKLDADTVAGENLDERLVFEDPSQFDAVYTRRTETELARSDLSEAQKIERAMKRRARLATAVQKSQIEKDPAAWLRANYGEAPGDRQPGGAPAGAAPAASVSPDLWSALLAQESGGRQMKDGRPVTSSAGAIGVAQLMPSTGPEAAKLAGLKWDERRFHQDAGYNEALGWAYFEKQLQDNGGDVRKALAAYNGGPGRLKDAVAKAGPDGDWLAKMPKETRDYVASISKKAGVDSVAPTGVQIASAGVDSASDAGSGMPAPAAQKSRTLSMVDPDMELQLKHYAETRVKQNAAQFRGEADRMLTDLTAGHKDGKVEQVPLDMAFFQKAYGLDAQRLHAEYQRSRAMGQDIASFGTMPEVEIAATIAQNAPAPGAGYAAADARQNARVQAATHVLQKRREDPVSYAVSTSPDARRYAEQLRSQGLSPQARQDLTGRYMDAHLAEQRRLGIREPRLLSPMEADAIGAKAMSATKPEDSANLIAGLESQYGHRYFPQVFQELVKKEKISGELMLIPNLPSQSARETVSRLARVKEADLAAGVPADSQKTTKDAVTESLAELVATVPILGAQSVGLMNSYESTMRKAAYEQIAAGASVGDAVKRARGMLLGHYQFSGSVRYPAAVEVGVMKSGMSDVVSNLRGIDAPPDLAGARDAATAQTAYLDMVKSRPLWHTTDDDSGVQLWVMRDNGTKVPVTRGGRPVVYTWQELAGSPGTLDRRSVTGKIQ